MISHKHKFLYIHIPKCGGVSIKNALKNNEVKRDLLHNDLNNKRLIKQEDKLKKYFKFSFVRNPWDRMISLYHYFSQFKESRVFYSDNINIIKKTQDMSFLDFCTKKNWQKMHNGFHFKPMTDWISNDSGSLSLDYIGRVESLQKDFDIICDKIGIPHQELPRKNKSKHKHYTEYYDDETKQIVAEKYAKDIKHFGYKFGE